LGDLSISINNSTSIIFKLSETMPRQLSGPHQSGREDLMGDEDVMLTSNMYFELSIGGQKNAYPYRRPPDPLPTFVWAAA
jgi:hypothetical protein